MNLEFDGPPAVHELFVLIRFSSRAEDPLRHYSVRRRATRNLAELQVSQDNRVALSANDEVDVGLLVENVETADAISRLLKSAGQGDFLSRHSRGLGSWFNASYKCAAAFVKPAPLTSGGGTSGAVEIETAIYYRETLDVKIHSVFRVESIPDLDVPER